MLLIYAVRQQQGCTTESKELVCVQEMEEAESIQDSPCLKVTKNRD